MLKYILKRLQWMIPVILGVSILIFFLVDLVPSDPASIVLGPTASDESIRAFNESIGYYDPFWVRYFNYMKGLVRLDFGTSYVSGFPVFNELKSKLLCSFTVAVSSILASLLLGVTIGVLSAVKQYSIGDTISISMAMLLAAAPSFWVGMVLLLEFSLKHQWFPAFGAEAHGWLVLPTVVLALHHGAAMIRFTRSSMLEAIRQDYVRTARAKGLKERIVIWKHVLKNALLPVITVAGQTFGALIGGAVVTETLFSLPGLGTFIVNGIKQKDMPVVMGGSIVLATMIALIQLIVDLAYAMVDPRIKAKYSEKRG